MECLNSVSSAFSGLYAIHRRKDGLQINWLCGLFARVENEDFYSRYDILLFRLCLLSWLDSDNMNGKNHERILNFLLPFIAFYLGAIHTNYQAAFIFWLLWKIGTYLITCDNDTKSRSTKRLWIIGWIIDKCFSHRGLLHNPLLWVGVGGIGYYFINWPICGLVCPQFVHILTDKVF